MRNAHLRLGSLEFTKWSNDSPSRIKVYLDRYIGEEPQSGSDVTQAHLISVFGNDQEIAAIWAAAATGERFVVEGLELASSVVSLGQEAQSFRGSISVPGRKRPLRHLIAISAEFAAGASPGRTILCDSDPAFVLYRLAQRFGLPVHTEWTTWFASELEKRGAVKPLVGLGCAPVVAQGTKDIFMASISRGLKRGLIRIPEDSGPVTWNVPGQFANLTGCDGLQEVA